MTPHDSQSSSDTERQALAMLVTRFSADRDALAAAVQRTEGAIRDLSGRLDAMSGLASEPSATHELDALRFELGRLEALVEASRDEIVHLRREVKTPREGMTVAAAGSVPLGPSVDVPAIVDDVRSEVRRMGAEITQQAIEHAERVAVQAAETAAEGQRSLRAALEESRAQLARALDDVHQVALASSERATQALGHTTDFERRGRELDAARTLIGQGREELLRRIDEHEARVGVRLDSIIAGVEGETRSVRDSFWDRLGGTEQRLHHAEAQLANLRVEVPQRAAEVLEGLAAAHGEIEQLQHRFGAAGDRLTALERQAARSGLAGMIGCVRDEIVAAMMLVVSVGAVVGRLALSFVR